jgi:hypothetical protein
MGISFSGWWYTYPSEKKYEFVSWDDYIFPTEWKFIKKNVPNHQPIYSKQHMFHGGICHSLSTTFWESETTKFSPP